MKTIFYSLILVLVSFNFVGCEASAVENETAEISNFELTAIDKDDAETIGTRDRD